MRRMNDDASAPRQCRDVRSTVRTGHAERTHHEAPLIDRAALLHLILRRVRQWAFVILKPNQIAPVEIAAANLASEKMFGLTDATPVGAHAEHGGNRTARALFVTEIDGPRYVRFPPDSDRLGGIAAGPFRAISEHIQLDCGPDPTSPALRASSASFVKIFFPAMRPDSQAPVI